MQSLTCRRTNPRFDPAPTEDYKRRREIIRKACAQGKELKWVVPRAKKSIAAVYRYQWAHYRYLKRCREALSEGSPVRPKHRFAKKTPLNQQVEYKNVLKNATESVDLVRELGPSAVRELQDFVFESHPILEAAREMAKERHSSVRNYVGSALFKAIELTRKCGFDIPSDIIEEITTSAAESEFRYYLELAVENAKRGYEGATRETLNHIRLGAHGELEYETRSDCLAYVKRYPGEVRGELAQEILSVAQQNRIIISMQYLMSKLERDDKPRGDLSTLELLNRIKEDQAELETALPLDLSGLERRVLIMILKDLSTLGAQSLDLMKNSKQESDESLSAVAKAIEALMRAFNELRPVELKQ